MSNETEFTMALWSTRYRFACATAGEEIKSRDEFNRSFASLFGDAQGWTDVGEKAGLYSMRLQLHAVLLRICSTV